MEDCLFEENSLISTGGRPDRLLRGGALSVGGDQFVTLTRCTFTSNLVRDVSGDHARGGAFAGLPGARVRIFDSIFQGNTCELTGNTRGRAPSGGALYNFDATFDLVRCAFVGNRAHDRLDRALVGRGGAIYNSSGGEIDCEYCLFSGNWSGGDGGAIYNNFNSEVAFFRCTIAGNSARQLGSGIYNNNSAASSSSFPPNRVLSSIIWGNGQSLASNVFTEGTIRFSNSIVQELDSSQEQLRWRDAGSNTYSSPQFQSPVSESQAPTSDGDYRLRPGSPAIDAIASSLTRFTDLDGNPANLDGDADQIPGGDQGAYEFFNPAGDSDQDGFTDGLELSISGGPLALAPPAVRSSILDHDGAFEAMEFQLDTPTALPDRVDFIIEHSLDLGTTSSWIPLDTAAPEILDLGTGDSRVTIRPAAGFSSPASGRRFFRIRMEEDTE